MSGRVKPNKTFKAPVKIFKTSSDLLFILIAIAAAGCANERPAVRNQTRPPGLLAAPTSEMRFPTVSTGMPEHDIQMNLTLQNPIPSSSPEGALDWEAIAQLNHPEDDPAVKSTALVAINGSVPEGSIAKLHGDLLTKGWLGIVALREISDPKCKETKVTSIEISRPTSSGGWTENWKVENCGKPVSYRLSVLPDSSPSQVRVRRAP
jgi:hypothetical protein